MLSPLSMTGVVLKTKIPGLKVDIIKLGTGTPIEESFNRHAKVITDFVTANLEKGGRLPDGRRVCYYKAGNKELYQVFFKPNKSKCPDVSYEASVNEASIITDRLKYFKRGSDLIRHLFRN